MQHAASHHKTCLNHCFSKQHEKLHLPCSWTPQNQTFSPEKALHWLESKGHAPDGKAASKLLDGMLEAHLIDVADDGHLLRLVADAPQPRKGVPLNAGFKWRGPARPASQVLPASDVTLHVAKMKLRAYHIPRHPRSGVFVSFYERYTGGDFFYATIHMSSEVHVNHLVTLPAWVSGYTRKMICQIDGLGNAAEGNPGEIF